MAYHYEAPPPRAARSYDYDRPPSNGGYPDRALAPEDRYTGGDRRRAGNHDRYDRDGRPGYSGPPRTGERREYERTAGYAPDPRRDYDRNRRDDHDGRPSVRYNPYPSPSSGRTPDLRAPAPAPPPGLMPLGAHQTTSPQAYYAPPMNAGVPMMGPSSMMHGGGPPPGAHAAPVIYNERAPPAARYEPNGQFNHGPPKEKSPPSQSAIFMGLPLHTDEANLRAFLEELGCAVDGCTIIYDRNTGQSKRYGFARFISVEHARAFIEPNFPIVVWKEPRGSRHEPTGDGLRVKIDYSQKEKIPYEARQDRSAPGTGGHRHHLQPGGAGGGGAYQASHEPAHATINDGARDVGGSPTSILLLRGLDALTTEQDIALSMQYIPDPSGLLTPDSVKKILLIKDRNTRSSWGFAFVQFADVPLASKAFGLLQSETIFPRGFQIKARVVSVTFAHEHSFHPVYSPSEWSFRGEGGQELTYWDDKAYASKWLPVGAAPAPTTKGAALGGDAAPAGREAGRASSPAGTVAEASKAPKDDDADMDAFLSSLGSKPEQAPPVVGLEASHAAPDWTTPTVSVPVGPTVNAAPEVGAPAFESTPAPPDVMMATPQNQTPLVAAVQAAAQASPHAHAPTHPPNPSPAPMAPLVPAAEEHDFRDLVKCTCILCHRQFKDVAQLDRHVKLSALHKSNLSDEKAVATAKARKTQPSSKAGKAQ